MHRGAWRAIYFMGPKKSRTRLSVYTQAETQSSLAVGHLNKVGMTLFQSLFFFPVSL